ncbi:MAG: hypothetical protein ISQ08_03775 [Planctomycetes bacterium]|nr:hypothetical protein [Planctomycetota bacterium]MDA0947227.1 hypothetical protein [Planctomycetota bacterium]
MTRGPLLHAFRERWLAGALPLVVEHRRGELEHVCAAPSLWMGGRELALGLQGAGFLAGQDLHLALEPGVRWVQGLVAGLRVGAVLHLGPSSPAKAWSLSSAGLAPPAVSPHDAAAGPARGIGSAELTRTALVRAGRCAPGAPVGLEPWTSSHATHAAGAALAALHDGAELHLFADSGPGGPEQHNLTDLALLSLS